MYKIATLGKSGNPQLVWLSQNKNTRRTFYEIKLHLHSRLTEKHETINKPKLAFGCLGDRQFWLGTTKHKMKPITGLANTCFYLVLPSTYVAMQYSALKCLYEQASPVQGRHYIEIFKLVTA